MKTIRASEIGSYLYCQRAWWYQRQGVETGNLSELAGGNELHKQHGKRVLVSGCLRTAAYLLLLGALILATIAVVNAVL